MNVCYRVASMRRTTLPVAHRRRGLWRGGICVLGGSLLACEYDMSHESTCTYADCGGTKAGIGGMIPIAPGEHPSFTFSFERNQRIYRDKLLRAEDIDHCDMGDDYAACAGVKQPGELCSGAGPPIKDTPVACVGVSVDGLQVKLVDGDQYHLTIKDASGTTIVDDRWTATYTNREPVACRNSNNVTCRFGGHQFTLL